MELAIPLVAFGGLFILSKQNKDKKNAEAFTQMHKKHLPNTNTPVKNWPIVNREELEKNREAATKAKFEVAEQKRKEAQKKREEAAAAAAAAKRRAVAKKRKKRGGKSHKSPLEKAIKKMIIYFKQIM